MRGREGISNMITTIIIIVLIAALNIVNGFLQNHEKLKAFSKAVPWVTTAGAILAVILAIRSLPVPEPTMLPIDGMLTEDAPGVEFRNLNGGKMYYSMKRNNELCDVGTQYTGKFIPEEEGTYFFQVTFLRKRGNAWQVDLIPAKVNAERLGTQNGNKENVSTDITADGSHGDGTDDNPVERLETTKVSQSYMSDENSSPNNITWGWGDTTEGGKGRERIDPQFHHALFSDHCF